MPACGLKAFSILSSYRIHIIWEVEEAFSRIRNFLMWLKASSTENISFWKKKGYWKIFSHMKLISNCRKTIRKTVKECGGIWIFPQLVFVSGMMIWTMLDDSLISSNNIKQPMRLIKKFSLFFSLSLDIFRHFSNILLTISNVGSLPLISS